MKQFLTILVLVAAAISLSFLPASQNEAAPAGPNLDTIKALVGTWVAADEDGNPTDVVMSVFRVTAGGSAVAETLFPGADHEMLTVYHMDGGDLVATHYCSAGNVPHFRVSQDDQGALVFECVRVRNAESHRDGHVHAGRVECTREQMLGRWTFHEDEVAGDAMEFNLVRVPQEPAQ